MILRYSIQFSYINTIHPIQNLLLHLELLNISTLFHNKIHHILYKLTI